MILILLSFLDKKKIERIQTSKLLFNSKANRITTLGSESSGGSVYSMNISDPLEYDLGVAMLSRRIDEISRFKSTIWTSDSNGNQAVIGKVCLVLKE